MNKLIKKLLKAFKKGKKLPKLTKIQIDVLKAVDLYQKEHNGMGMPNDMDIMMHYVDKVNKLK